MSEAPESVSRAEMERHFMQRKIKEQREQLADLNEKYRDEMVTNRLLRKEIKDLKQALYPARQLTKLIAQIAEGGDGCMTRSSRGC